MIGCVKAVFGDMQKWVVCGRAGLGTKSGRVFRMGKTTQFVHGLYQPNPRPNTHPLHSFITPFTDKKTSKSQNPQTPSTTTKTIYFLKTQQLYWHGFFMNNPHNGREIRSVSR